MITYTFTALNHPTKYPIYDKINGNIPVGATGVEVAYGQSTKTYVDKKTGQTKQQNVYRWKGKIYNEF